MKKLICVIIFISFMAVGLSATPSLTLQWTNSITPEVTGYNLYRSLVSDGPYTIVNTAAITPDLSGTTQYTDTTVKNNKRYYYVCRAFIMVDDPLFPPIQILESINSNEATEYIMPPAPTPPSGLIKKSSTP